MRGKLVERRGGWDCHGLPVEIAVEQQLGISSKHEIEEFGIAEFNQRCRESVFEFLEDWERAHGADRLLGRPRPGVPHARPELHRVGLVGAEADPREGPALRGPQGRAVLPALRDRAVQPRGRAGLQGRRRPVDLRAHAGRRGRRPGAARRRAAHLDHDAVDPGVQRRDRRRPRADLRAREDRAAGGAGRARRGARGARARRGRADPRPLPAAPRWTASATTRRSRSSRRASTASAGHTVLLADFVSADDGTGLVHTAIAFGEDDFRLGERYGLTVVNPVRPDGTYDERIGKYAGRYVKDADPDLIEDLRAARPHPARRGARALLPALLALGRPAPLLREADLVHRDVDAARPPRRPRTRRSTGIPSTSSTGASGTGSPATSTGRSRASATGARRCRCGATRTATSPSSGPSPSSRSSRA